MIFLKEYWKIVAIGAAVLILFGAGYYKGHSNEKAKFEAYVQAQKELAIAQQAKVDLIKSNQATVLNQTSNAYNETIKRIKSYYAKNKPNIIVADKLRDSPSPNTMPNIQEAPTGIAQVGGNQNPAFIEQDCAITTAQYNALWDSWSDLCKVSGCD